MAADGPGPGALDAWRRWRRSRPFWGGLLILLGGAEILLSERAPLPTVIHVGVQGMAGYLVPAILLLCGLLVWFSPAQRTFYSILAVLLSLGSWITSNLGGFFVGMALGLVGGSLAFAWTRGSDSKPPAEIRPPPRRPEPPAGLDVILRNPPAEPGSARSPEGRRQSRGEDTEPLGHGGPDLGQDAAAPGQHGAGPAKPGPRLPARRDWPLTCRGWCCAPPLATTRAACRPY